MFDKLMNQHKNPVNLILHLIGCVILIYGFWNHNCTAIVIGVILPIIGHLYVCASKPKKQEAVLPSSQI